MSTYTILGFDWIDFAVIGAYIAIVLFVGLYSSWINKQNTVSGYFMASRSVNFIPLGASIFASNIGSGHFVGLAGAAAEGGIAIAGFEFNANFCIIFLGWLFVPVYLASGVLTMPEYLKLRFGGKRIQYYLSILALLLYVFTKISADLFAGAIFITKSTNLDGNYALYVSVIILLVVAAIFTITGGLTAVIWTDFVQTVLMLFGSILLAAFAFYEVGGYESMVKKYFMAVSSNRSFVDPSDENSGFCGAPNENAMHLMRPATGTDLPWTGMIFGLTISSIWYWCSDQVIVQRALAAKSLTHAKGGCILSAYLKLLPLWIMIFPGMIARILFPDEVACATEEDCLRICSSNKGCSNIAYVKLVSELMPRGLRGLMLAVMLSSLMSSLSSIFNSASTIFTIDLYLNMRKKATDIELLIVGRLFVFFLAVISVLWIPIISASQGSKLFDYIQATTSNLAPPICAVYVLAMFWPRINEPGAFWGLLVGLIVGIIRFVLSIIYSNPACGSNEIPPEWWITWINNVHYLHFGCILWLITVAVCIIVSYSTPQIPEQCLYRLTFWSRYSTKHRISIDDAKNNEWINKSNISLWKKVQKIFGCSVHYNLQQNQKQESVPEKSNTIYETFYWTVIGNLNAIIVLCITIFFYAYYV